MRLSTAGLHHVTAIARDAAANAEFYVRVLGLRMVKRTINFDDPGSYHLYYGDAAGRPGTLLTFFIRPWEQRGRPGRGQATLVAFSVPSGSLPYWSDRLAARNIRVTQRTGGREADAVSFADPDGLELRLVDDGSRPDCEASASPDVPASHSIRGLHGITLLVTDTEPTGLLLTRALGLAGTSRTGDRLRFRADGQSVGLFVDVLQAPDGQSGSIAAGSVHHVAFRAPGTKEQLEWQRELRSTGLDVTDVKDRTYFRSIYFTEPGGVRFEIATDTPGFAVDESPELLGTRLQLPAGVEPKRADLEARIGMLP